MLSLDFQLTGPSDSHLLRFSLCFYHCLLSLQFRFELHSLLTFSDLFLPLSLLFHLMQLLFLFFSQELSLNFTRILINDAYAVDLISLVELIDVKLFLPLAIILLLLFSYLGVATRPDVNPL